MKLKENKLSWTDDRIGLLKRMWKEGKSAADIAKALGKGVTRNAVIGKAHRLGLSGRPVAAGPVAGKKPDVKEVKKSAPAVPAKKEAVKEVKGFKKPAAPAPAVKGQIPGRQVEEPRKFEKEEIPPGGGVALIDLTERMCKWPIGDPREAEFTFCGRGIRVGTPYCPEHAAAAYQTSSRRTPVVHAAVVVTPVANEDKEVEEEVEEEEIETVT